MKNWSKTKKLAIILAALMLCWAAWRELLGYEAVPFDLDVQGIVDVVVVDHHGDDGTPHYYHIGVGRIKREAEPFETDDMTVYTVDHRGLETYIDRSKNKVLNRLLYISIEDAQGNAITPTAQMEALVTCAAGLEHDIMELHIFQLGGELFLQTELNVNWWCPVELYWYDQQNDRLVELYTFDGLEVVGMRIRDLTRAQ